MTQPTVAVIIGNREFFSDDLVRAARREVLDLARDEGIETVVLDEATTKLGAVESIDDGWKCARLLEEHRQEIDGILVVLPNFGNERAIAECIASARLDVPVLVQAYPDTLDQFGKSERRDAFCGKISVCNALKQYGVRYSLTSTHVGGVRSPTFHQDLRRFLAVCRVVNGMRTARVGVLGTRPTDFTTVRYSEKLLQRAGISVVPMDLNELLSQTRTLEKDDARIADEVRAIVGYADASAVPVQKLRLIGAMGAALRDWVSGERLDAVALQCWPNLQTDLGVNVCTSMSMLSDGGVPSACEADVTGALSMLVLQLASGHPAALVDWNNNYGAGLDKVVAFHCGNWARAFLPGIKIGTAEILGTVLGDENTWGAVEGRTPAGPMTFARLTTDDAGGRIRAYVGEGMFTDDPLDTFGSRAVVQISALERLLAFVCREGFEHHAAMTLGSVADVVYEAASTYLGWEVYRHA